MFKWLSKKAEGATRSLLVAQMDAYSGQIDDVQAALEVMHASMWFAHLSGEGLPMMAVHSQSSCESDTAEQLFRIIEDLRNAGMRQQEMLEKNLRRNCIPVSEELSNGQIAMRRGLELLMLSLVPAISPEKLSSVTATWVRYHAKAKAGATSAVTTLRNYEALGDPLDTGGLWSTNYSNDDLTELANWAPGYLSDTTN